MSAGSRSNSMDYGDTAMMRTRRVPIHDPAPRIARTVPTHGVAQPHDYRYGDSDPALRPVVPETGSEWQ
jgi:hypothetical protein